MLSNLKLVELLTPFLIIFTQNVNFIFLGTNLSEELRISGFAAQEFVNDVLDVGVAGGRSDFLKSLFNLSGSEHFLLHLGFQEGRPKLLGKEILLHLKLIRVLVFICRRFRNFLLSGNSRQSAINSILLILSRI